MRWRQFDLLVRAAAQMREPGFALALHYAVTGEAPIGKRAVDWALGPGTDLRQLALVYDWCQPLLSEPQAKALAAKLRRLAEQSTGNGIEATRDRVLAAIAAADDAHAEENALREMVTNWWRVQTAPRLADGRLVVGTPELFALFEILHATRDNMKIDLREAAPDYFRELPKFQVLANYPAPLAAPENEYRIPVYQGSGQPDLDRAALARAAGLSTVAYDNNALENQYLQGWLIQDRFMLQGIFGAPYEFLWANPYQPGLSYFQLPVFFHDQHSGALFLRSNWEDDAVWFGIYAGEAQLFREGRVTVLNQKGPPAEESGGNSGGRRERAGGTQPDAVSHGGRPGSGGESEAAVEIFGRDRRRGDVRTRNRWRGYTGSGVSGGLGRRSEDRGGTAWKRRNASWFWSISRPAARGCWERWKGCRRSSGLFNPLKTAGRWRAMSNTSSWWRILFFRPCSAC